MTLSPTFTPSGCRRPSSRRLPLPTATTSPCIGFSWAVSGMMMPDLVLVSASVGFNSRRSCNGLNFMVFPLSWNRAAYRKRRRLVSTRHPALELGGRGRVQGHREPGNFALVVAAADIAVAIEPGKGGAVAERHRNLTSRGLAAEPIFDCFQE